MKSKYAKNLFTSHYEGEYIYIKNISSESVVSRYEQNDGKVCKPCWELKYCPYGPLVELMPLPKITRPEAIEHNDYLRSCLATGILGSGESLDNEKRQLFEEMVRSFDPQEYPEKILPIVNEMSCTVFGHICPVFVTAEDYTETGKARKKGRYIPDKTKIKIARRDNYTCQICGKNLKDEELEFDHVIPISKGGCSEENNIRLTCFKCNRSKGNKIEI